jgi:hypothetical protein
MALSRYPGISLAQARRRHLEARKLLAPGVHPMGHPKTQKTAKCVAGERSFAS